MRIAHATIVVALLSSSAFAEGPELNAKVEGEKAEPIVGFGMQLGELNNKVLNDSADRGPGVFKGLFLGWTGFVRHPLLRTRYHTNLGWWLTGDLLLFQYGVAVHGDEMFDTAPDHPPGYIMHLGGASGLALDMVHTHRFLATLDFGGHASTDFYGVNGELGVRFAPKKADGKWGDALAIVIAYRMRSGFTWDHYHHLDERWRVGIGWMKSSFIGIEHLHGYAEDEMQRADLHSIFKGSFSMTSLVFAWNTEMQ